MKKQINIVLSGLLMFVFTACNKELADNSDGVVTFSIVPSIMATGSADIAQEETRAKIEGESFPAGSMIGLGISASSSLSSYYTNFYGLTNGATWYYYLNNINSGDRLSGFSYWEEINLYGYYPYNASATNLASIPFRIATPKAGVLGEAEGADSDVFTDYMVAGTATKRMDTNTPPLVSLTFGHLMTAIELRIKRSHNNQPILKLGSVTYEIENPRSFIISGTYKAVNPDMSVLSNNISPVETVNKMTIAYPSHADITNNSTSTRLLMLMPELRQNSTAGFENATVKLTFHFTDQDGEHYIFENAQGGDPAISFTLASVTNSGTTDSGLLAGYSYAVTATLGTYTHFAAPTTGTPIPPQVINNALVDSPDDSQIDI